MLPLRIGWADGRSFFVVVIIVVNALMQSNVLSYRNKAFGLNYNIRSPYSLPALDSLSSAENAARDKQNMLGILENWKKKNSVSAKTKMVYIN
ncbi:MAG: hypothetical protein R2794_07850 [Chitinophagales bacterium]